MTRSPPVPAAPSIFPPGSTCWHRSLTLSGAARLTFRGASRTTTEFLTTPASGNVLNLERSADVTIRDFCIDGQVMNFTQGTITAYSAAENTITVRLDAGYPTLDAPQLAGAHTLFTFYDAARASYDADHPTIKSERSVSAGVWELTLDHLPVKAYVGEKVAVWNRDRINGKAIGLDDNRNVTLININDYCGGWSMPLICGGNTGALKFTNFNVGPPPGSHRLITAQGGLAAYNRAAITLKNCDWREIDDDCLDIGEAAAHILSQQAPDRITVSNAHWGTVYQVGDTLRNLGLGDRRRWHPRDGSPHGGQQRRRRHGPHAGRPRDSAAPGPQRRRRQLGRIRPHF